MNNIYITFTLITFILVYEAKTKKICALILTQCDTSSCDIRSHSKYVWIHCSNQAVDIIQHRRRVRPFERYIEAETLLTYLILIIKHKKTTLILIIVCLPVFNFLEVNAENIVYVWTKHFHISYQHLIDSNWFTILWCQ